MNDSKNKTDTFRFARSASRLTNRDNVFVWLSLAWFVALCGAAVWVLFPRRRIERHVATSQEQANGTD